MCSSVPRHSRTHEHEQTETQEIKSIREYRMLIDITKVRGITLEQTEVCTKLEIRQD